MEEEKDKKTEEDKQKKGRKPDQKLPFFTTAPSAEHFRGADDDEPCDDGRTGDS